MVDGRAIRANSLVRIRYPSTSDLVASRQLGGPSVIIKKDQSELGETIVIETRAPGCSRLVTAVSVWDHVPRVEVSNRLCKIPTTDKQSVFFAFPFLAPSAQLSFELPGGCIVAGAPSVPGCPRHMRAVRNWVGFDMLDRAIAWATVDAPLIQVGDVHCPYSPFPGALPLEVAEPTTLYSWALNNIWDTNFPSMQGGEMTFRYAVSSASGQSLKACGLGTRLADELATPLLATLVPTSASVKALGQTGSLRGVENAEVRLLQATASADCGQLAVWLNNLAAGEVSTGVGFPEVGVRSATVGTVLGEQLAEVPFRNRRAVVNLKPGETRVLTLQLGLA